TDGSSANTIGGSSSVDPSTGKLSGEGNLISGNLNSGVQIVQSNGNTLLGNFIGTDATGESPLGNDPTGYFDDVDVFDSSYTTIGGASTVDAYGNLSGLGNLTASNVGVEITDALTDFSTYGGTPSVDNVVQGNFIGTNVNGTTPLGVGNGVILLAV